MNRFFNEFDAFLATSKTSAVADRLNARHQAIIAGNLPAIAGKRILDIASHDGRWTFAALKAGAMHVVGIEPRADLIANAQATFERYGISRDRYEFVEADVFEALKRESPRVDTVLCLGFYYHTVRHVELADMISTTGAQCVIVDTEIVPRAAEPPAVSALPGDERGVFANRASIELFTEPVDHESMAFGDSATRGGHAIVGRPSREAIALIMRHFGYAVAEYDWPGLLRGLPQSVVADCLREYSEGWRSTFCCNRVRIGA